MSSPRGKEEAVVVVATVAMGFLKQLLTFALVGASLQGLALGADYPQADIDSGKVLQELSKTARENALARLGKSSSTCTKENVRVRKEW